MTWCSKNVFIDKLDDTVGKYNSTYHRTIKVKLIDVNLSAYFDFEVESDDKDAKFVVSDHVRLSRYKNIFAKGYSPNWSVEVFVFKIIKNTVTLAMRNKTVLVWKFLEHFIKKNCKGQTKQSFEWKK